jgi:hypothetical protein
MGHTISITGAPGVGKTPFALYPHPNLGGTLTQVAFDRVAAQLQGIPQEWRGRVTVLTPGVKDGARLLGAAWMRDVETILSQPLGTDTIVLDTLSHMAQARYFDVLRPKNGIPSEKYIEYHAPQNMVKDVLDKVIQANPDANVIVLTHAKEKRNERYDIMGYSPELVGGALNSTWASRFEAVIALEKREARKKGEAAQHLLLLDKQGPWDFLMCRRGLGAPVEEASVDITITEPGKFEPIKRGWDALFRALGA